MSEITPEKYRFTVASCAKVFWLLGTFCAKLMGAEDDPGLTYIHWRTLLLISAAFPLIFFVAGLLLLRESPVFLASVGRHEEAHAVLADLKRMNGASAEIEYDHNKACSPQGEEAALSLRLQMLFSPKYCTLTTSLLVLDICYKLVWGGFIYSAPWVLKRLTPIPAADELLILAGSGLVAALSCIYLTSVFSRVSIMRGTYLVMLMAMTVLAMTIWNIDFLSTFYNFRVQVSLIAFYMALNVADIMTDQIGADGFPPFVASTALAMFYVGDKSAEFVAPIVVDAVRSKWKCLFAAGVTITALAFLIVSGCPVSWNAYNTRDEDVEESASQKDINYGSNGTAGCALFALPRAGCAQA